MLQLSPERPLASPADLAHCRQMIRDGSKSFFLASLLLPRRTRDPARSLYAFCRLADDRVDQSADCAGAVEGLRRTLDDIYQFRSLDHPAERAFADVARDFAIPRALPEALIDGFAWDGAARTYDTLSDVIAYGMRVAGTVGAMMALLMNTRSPQAIARACDLGVAMQLTNIARDVGEDARHGRLYLPRQWMVEEGINPVTFLARPVMSAGLARVVRRLLAEADGLYSRSIPGIQMLPAACRPAIHAAQLLYAEIGREVERAACDSVSRRASVSPARKTVLLAAAVAAAARSAAPSGLPPLPEAAFVCEAVATAPKPALPPAGFDARSAWLVGLLIRLEKQRS